MPDGGPAAQSGSEDNEEEEAEEWSNRELLWEDEEVVERVCGCC